jgi:hypothetical protein
VLRSSSVPRCAPAKSIVVRALADALDPLRAPRVKVVLLEPCAPDALETEYEIFLHEQNRPASRSRSRPGGELGPHGRRTGAITLEDLFEQMLRFNLNRAQQDDYLHRCAGSER